MGDVTKFDAKAEARAIAYGRTLGVKVAGEIEAALARAYAAGLEAAAVLAANEPVPDGPMPENVVMAIGALHGGASAESLIRVACLATNKAIAANIRAKAEEARRG